MPSPVWYRIIYEVFSKLVLRVRQYILDVYREGSAFDASKRFTLSPGASADVVVVNPSGSGVDLYLIDIEVTTTGTVYIDLYQDSTISSNGSEVPVLSKRVGSSKTPKGKVYHSGSYTPGQQVMETLGWGGVKNFASGGQVAVGVGIIIDEGHNLHIRITNPSNTDTITVSVRIIWYEE